MEADDFRRPPQALFIPNRKTRNLHLITLHTLASGSSGNALAVSQEQSHLLVDAGISCRRITQGLHALGLTPEALDAILITHTHTDHIAGLQTLLKHTRCPIYATERACRELAWRLPASEDRLAPLPLCRPLEIGAFTVTAFPISHDAPGPCGFRLDSTGGSVGILTDTGYVPDEAAELLPGVDLAVLEANHDVETLRSGAYPYYLKQRILGPQGHLCNEDAARFAVQLAESGTGELVLAHLSQDNNTPAMALRAVETALSAAGLAPALSVAPRDRLSQTYQVSGRAVCRK